MDLGLEAAGFVSRGCFEWNLDAQRSIAANRGNAWQIHGHGDISEDGVGLTPRNLGLRKGELDLLAGGPPCQPFSKAAQWSSSSRSGPSDPRHRHIESFFEIARKFAPKFILIENVQGYIQGPTSALLELEEYTRELAQRTRRPYQLQSRIVDAADYGVPQHRKRAIVVISTSNSFVWPKKSRVQRSSWDAIGKPPKLHITESASGRWAGLLNTIPEGQNYQWHTDRGGGSPLFGYRTRYWSFLQKLHRLAPSPTLAASPGPSTGPFHWDSRPLSIWEMLRLQTFPGHWTVCGDRREQVRQVGNATPPLLAERIGRQIAIALNRTPSRRLCYSISKQIDPVSVIEVEQQIPSKYLKYLGVHTPHPGVGLGPSPRS